MPIDKVSRSKLPKWAARDTAAGQKFDTATYMGVVKDNKDPIRGGRLRVWIPDFGGDQTDEKFWQTVSYASPFFGATFVGDAVANNKFTTTNHTYGMWMVPPDINNQVLCTFVNGDPDRGFWFACVNPTLSHWMVPGIAAGNKVDTGNVSDIIGASITTGQSLPVVEYNDSEATAFTSTFFNNPKPVHEWQANILFQQGLDKDPVRGATSSTSQRESPSHVFGISTPGRAYGNDPAEDPEYGKKLADGTITEKDYAVSARKGGHTFVMDDGDVEGTDQLVRIRSAGGHEILMNDKEQTLYIINSAGSNWIELNQDGTMNIYNSGSFSVRSEGDINFYSDANVNIDSASSINFNAATSIKVTSADIGASATNSMLLYGASKMDVGTGGTLTTGAATTSIGSTGPINIAGTTLDLNSNPGSNNITGFNPQTSVFPDASYDTATRQWASKPQQVTSIVTTLPTHEPYPRTPPGPIPTKTLAAKTCEIKNGQAPASYTLPPANGNKLDGGKVRGQPVPWTTDSAFLDKVKSVASSLNLNYMDMLACMHLETIGTMDPGITNSLGFTGLIQFGKPAATACGTTQESLRNMDRVTQCDYVLKYFQVNKLNQKAPNPRLVDIYLTILWPAAVGQALDKVIWSQNDKTAVFYNANHGFDTTKSGQITVQMVATSIDTHLAAVKQALANAGAKSESPPGQLQSGSGATVTDGSGKPINAGSANTGGQDVGLTQAAGKSVSGTCPPEWMNRKEAYDPPATIGTASPSFTQLQVKALHAELGYFESQWAYDKFTGTQIGKYQFSADELAGAGYIKPDAITQYQDGTLGNGESWSGKDKVNSQGDFVSAKQQQDIIQNNEFTDFYAALGANGGIVSSDDICTAAGMVFVAHMYRSADLALQWRKQGFVDNPPANIGKAGTPEDYFNHGRYAIDILAVNAQPSPADRGKPPNGSNLTGIDPNAVLAFAGSGSGTLSGFQQTSTAFQDALLQAAQAYLQATGKKIMINSAYRSAEYQQGLYDRWVQAGGHMPDKPTAGGITTPTNPRSSANYHDSHGDGVAIDSSQSESVSNTIDLPKYGLRWGGTFRSPDRVHIQLAAFKP